MRYVFADFELDPGSYRLTRAGTDVRVEPRVLELLALLIAERHRVVPKDELVKRLWAGAFVSDSVLSRAAYEARRALGDDSGDQRFIKTVHGRGYQFVAPVVERAEAVPESARVGEPAVAEPAVDGAAPAPPTAVSVPTDPDSSSDNPKVSVPASSVGAPGRPTGPAGAPRMSRPRPVLWGGLALVALVAMAASALLRPSGTAPSETPAGGEPPGRAVVRLAIVPVGTADASDAELSLVALSVTDLLSARLQAQPGLIVRSPEYAAALSRTSPSLAAFAADAEVGWLLTGTVRRIPQMPRAHLTVQLHAAGTAGTLESVPLGGYELPLLESSADLDEFLRVRETLAARIEERLVPAVGAPGPVVPPHDPEAYRLYLLARQRLETLSCGEAPDVEDLLTRSLQIDPDFALAWLARGFVLYSQTWACGREVVYAERALAAVDAALGVDPDLPEAVYLKVVLLTEMGRAEEAYAAALEAHGRQPHVPVILLAQAYVLRYAGFLDQSSRALERALALDPLVLLEWREPPLTLLYQGRFQEFLKYVAAETGSYELFHRGWAELLRGNRAAALHAVESAFARNPADLFGRYGSALAAWLSGDPETGLVIVRGIVQQRDTLRTPDGEMTYREAQLLAAFGDEPSAVVRLARAVEQGFFCPSCLEAGPFLSALRGAAGFDAVLSRASSRHHEFGTRFAFDDLTADPTPPSRRD